MASSTDLNIAVLGAGVIGLTTSLCLQAELRNAKITIFADKFTTETTSSVAAGLFRPGTSFSGPDRQTTQKWITDSFRFWNELIQSPEGANAGVEQTSGYIFSSQYPHLVKNAYLEDLVPIYRPATEKERKLCEGDWKYGAYFTTVVTQCTKYLPWAANRFQGEIRTETIKSFADYAKYDVVVNCTGLGAKWLCNDAKLVPIRGQVVKVRAPWLKNFFYADYDTYIIPGVDNTVTLGGCRQYESYNTQIDRFDKASILERCESFVPRLKRAEFIADKVGLRPHRDPVRVEREILRFGGGAQLKIVHNYGHGGYGVTTAPGTALHAVELVREVLAGNSKL